MGGTVRMLMFVKRASDAEFIDALRKEYRAAPVRRQLGVAGGLILIFMGLVAVLAVPNVIMTRLMKAPVDAPRPEALMQRYDRAVHQAMIGGVGSGVAGAACLLMGVGLLADAARAAKNDRTLRMLLECYDARQGAAGQGGPAHSPGTESPAPPGSGG